MQNGDENVRKPLWLDLVTLFLPFRRRVPCQLIKAVGRRGRRGGGGGRRKGEEEGEDQEEEAAASWWRKHMELWILSQSETLQT